MVNLPEFFRKTYAKFTNWKLISSFWYGKVDIFGSKTLPMSEIVG